MSDAVIWVLIGLTFATNGASLWLNVLMSRRARRSQEAS